MRKLIIILLSMVSISVAAQYKISANGINFIKSVEQCSLTSYWDSNGWSVGYGHHKSDVYKGMKISKKQAENYLMSDIAEAEKSVARLLKALPYEYTFSQGFIDGLVSLVYNCGEGGVKSSTFYTRLNNCRVKKGKMDKSDFDWTLAAVKTCRVSSKGHTARRAAEYKMMCN